MKKGELITALGFIIASIVTLGEAFRLGFGWVEEQGPAAGFTLFWLGLLMLLCSIMIFVAGLKKKNDGEPFFVSKEGLLEAVKIFFTASVFTVGIVYTGVYWAIIGYCLLFTRWLGKHRWSTVILFTVIMTAAVYFGMEKGLQLPLPKSFLYKKGLFPF
ncbi:tripartite tricarboxylate transporter TctB family protein [bacterium BMS3Abin14]|nr:tripartite tricarboxylate transporter TctB family protein [bacterium BMS3Abin14]